VKYVFRIEENDYYEFNKYHAHNTPSLKRRTMATRIILPIVILALANLVEQSMDFSGPKYVYYGIFLAMALCVFLFYNQIANREIKRFIKRTKKTGRLYFDSEIAYEFLEDSFTETTQDSASTFKYSIITKVSIGKNAFYLYISAQTAHILPFRVFASDSDREEFLRFIQSKVTDIQN